MKILSLLTWLIVFHSSAYSASGDKKNLVICSDNYLYVEIQNDSISDILTEIENCKALRVSLKIHIEKVNEDLFKFLKDCTELYIESDQLKSLPESFSLLSKLNSLEINSESLASLYNFPHPNNIASLDLNTPNALFHKYFTYSFTSIRQFKLHSNSSELSLDFRSKSEHTLLYVTLDIPDVTVIKEISFGSSSPTSLVIKDAWNLREIQLMPFSIDHLTIINAPHLKKGLAGTIVTFSMTLFNTGVSELLEKGCKYKDVNNIYPGKNKCICGEYLKLDVITLKNFEKNIEILSCVKLLVVYQDKKVKTANGTEVKYDRPSPKLVEELYRKLKDTDIILRSQAHPY